MIPLRYDIASIVEETEGQLLTEAGRMILRNSVVKLVCYACGGKSDAINDKTDSECRALGERWGWRAVGDRDWCPECVKKGRAKP